MASEPKILVVLAGISGSGKSHLTNVLARERGFTVVPSLTTRQPRPEEASARDRRFCSLEEFNGLREKQRVLCGRFFFGHWYGLDTAIIDGAIAQGDAVVQLTYKSLLILKARYPHAKSVYIAPPTLETATQAVIARNLTAEETAERVREIEAETSWIAADRATTKPLFDVYFQNTRSPNSVGDFFKTIDALRR